MNTATSTDDFFNTLAGHAHLTDRDRMASLITAEDDPHRVADLGTLPDDGVGGRRGVLYRLPADVGPTDGDDAYAKTWVVVGWCPSEEYTLYRGFATEVEAVEWWAGLLVDWCKGDAQAWARERARWHDRGAVADGLGVEVIWPAFG